MIITGANIQLSAQHRYQEKHEVKEHLEFWVAEDQEPDWQLQQGATHTGQLVQIERQELDLTTNIDAQSRLNLLILQAMFRQVTGRSMLLFNPGELDIPSRDLALDFTFPSGDSLDERLETAGFGLVYERHERYQESERMQFDARGVIKTRDGREIAFNVSLGMSRQYFEASSLIVRAGDTAMIDPLVINFDGTGAQLSETRFAFDLDANGTKEQLALLRPGSGFLALDRNGDGVINDGSELFGPVSGQGFAELAAYDEDGNGFIDSGDSIYDQLRIWVINEDGSSQLFALGEKGIGAIFLGHVSTPFQLKDGSNRSLGEVVRSGVYITEQGQAGVVQELNLAV